MGEPTVPKLISKARAAAILAVSRPTLDRLIADGSIHTVGAYNQIARSELEQHLGRPIDLAAWDEATIRLSHQNMTRAEFSSAQTAAA